MYDISFLHNGLFLLLFFIMVLEYQKRGTHFVKYTCEGLLESHPNVTKCRCKTTMKEHEYSQLIFALFESDGISTNCTNPIYNKCYS